MTTRTMPAVVAVVMAVLVAVTLFVPYVAHQYRRHGEFGPGRAMLSFAALVYLFALFAYVLLPLPLVNSDFCARWHTTPAQLTPFKFVHDVRTAASGTGVESYLYNEACTQAVLNIALFVPLGMFVRYLLRRRVTTAALLGFAVSLFIEVTQLTGDWFLYPCPYRLFDVDDLVTNTCGGVLGACAAPVLRLIPGQRLPDAEPAQPRRVTAARRVLGIVCDLVLYNFLNVCVAVGIVALLGMIRGELFEGIPLTTRLNNSPEVEFFATWFPWALLAVVVPMAGSGASLGQRIVQLDACTVDGSRPVPERRLLRSLSGTGGLLTLNLLLTSARLPAGLAQALWFIELVLLVVSFLAVLGMRGRRGLSYGLTGLRLVDARVLGRRRHAAEPGVRSNHDGAPADGRVERV